MNMGGHPVQRRILQLYCCNLSWKLFLLYRTVACGEQHTIVTTASDVMSCGSNEHGQLGYCISDDRQDQGFSHFLRPIPSLHNMSVIQVVCGSSHTICLTAQSQASCASTTHMYRSCPDPWCWIPLWVMSEWLAAVCVWCKQDLLALVPRYMRGVQTPLDSWD
jgi:hypothetical protein